MESYWRVVTYSNEAAEVVWLRRKASGRYLKKYAILFKLEPRWDIIGISIPGGDLGFEVSR